MKTTLSVIILSTLTLTLTACVDTERQKKQQAESSWLGCEASMIDAQMAGHEGASATEIRNKLFRCAEVKDELFIEKALKEFGQQSRFKDPNSLQYQDVRRDTPFKVVGKYNAKNSYGAYTGFKRFTIRITSKTGYWVTETSDY